MNDERPRTRAECPATGPCPWVGCRHHLALEVTKSGAIRFAATLDQDGNPDLEAMVETCSLRASPAGETLDLIGRAMNITRERVRQIEETALARVSRTPLARAHARGEIIDEAISFTETRRARATADDWDRLYEFIDRRDARFSIGDFYVKGAA